MSIRNHPTVAALLRHFPGAEIVDAHAPPAEPQTDEVYVAPQPGERRQHSLGAVRMTLINEADRIRAVQAALVENGDRAEPHAGELRRADEFDAAALLIDRCKADPEIMARLKKGPGK